MNFPTIILVNATRKGFIWARSALKNPNSIDAKSLTTREGFFKGRKAPKKIPIQDSK